MGTRNADLIRACEHARSTLKVLSKLVDESQAACEHPPMRIARLTPGRLVEGGPTRFCLECSKPLP